MRTKSDNSVLLGHFTAGQAKRASGLSYAQVNRLANEGVVSPSVRDASGPNSCRVYSFHDLVALRVAASLLKANIRFCDVVRVVDYLKSLDYRNTLAGPYLVVPHGGDVCLVKETSLVSALKSPGQLYFVYDLGDAVESVVTIARDFAPPDRGKARTAVA